jgi:hypothetical protein
LIAPIAAEFPARGYWPSPKLRLPVCYRPYAPNKKALETMRIGFSIDATRNNPLRQHFNSFSCRWIPRVAIFAGEESEFVPKLLIRPPSFSLSVDARANTKERSHQQENETDSANA